MDFDERDKNALDALISNAEKRTCNFVEAPETIVPHQENFCSNTTADFAKADMDSELEEMSAEDLALKELFEDMERWLLYQSSSTPEQERKKHGGYVRWCGCDPDNLYELEDLRAEREVISAQREYADAMYVALVDEAERWKGHNSLAYAEKNLAWTKQREKQLKQQLKYVKASRKKLWEIAYNCEKAANRWADYHHVSRKNTASNPKWANVYKFRQKWFDKAQEEARLQMKLQEIKQEKKAAKDNYTEIRRRIRGKETPMR